MKKILTFIVALVVSMMTLQAGAAMYIVGSDPFGGWKTNAGVQMTASGSTYTATVDISGDVYFVFATQLCSSADDWNTFNRYRLGPKTNDYVVSTGSTYTAYTNQGGNSFKFTGSGSYVFTFNGSNNQFTINEATGPVTAGDLYVLGEVNGNGWSPATGVKMNYSESSDLYTATVTTAGENEGYSYFSFTTRLSNDPEDWAGIASYRYGAVTNDFPVVADTQMQLQAGENAFMIPAGTWTITVSLTNGYVMVHKEGDAPGPQPGDLYILGEVNGNTWAPNVGVPMTQNESGLYTATVTTAGENEGYSYFSFTTRLSNDPEDWDGIASYRYGAESVDFPVVADTHMQLQQGENAFMIPAGTWTVTVSLTDNYVMVHKDGDGPGPQPTGDLYILGEVNGNTWAPNVGVAMTQNESGLYTATVTTAGENEGYSYFSFTTRLSNDSEDWDGIASYRYGAESVDFPVVADTQMQLQQGENAFMIPAGTWTVTVSLTNNYVMVHQEGAGPGPQPTGDLFIMGEVNGNTWAPNVGVPMTQNESTGLYTATVTFNGEHSEEDANVSYFSFTTKLAGDGEDWEDINGYRLTPIADEGTNFWVTSAMLGHELALNNMGENVDVSFRIPAGTYTITVNLANRICVITSEGGTTPVAGKGWPAMYGGVMLQGFYWDSYKATKWNTLKDKAQELGQYFDIVWVPNSGSVDPYGTAESMGYMPVYWLKHNTCFGTEAQLRDMISTFHEHNTSVLMDMVINHKSGKSGWVDFANETVVGPVTGENYSMTWSLGDICRTDECVGAGYAATGAADEGEDFDGSRDLDHTSANVQKNVKTYQQYIMKELGYDGFRYDMCKGYAGYYVGLYNKASEPAFSVGEYWDGNAETLRWWLNETKQDNRIQTAVFDFALKYPMQSAFAGGTWSALNDKGLAADPNYQRYSVTFVDNHDTGQSGNYDCLKTNVMAANAFILTMPGTPCVFYKHYNVYKDEITNCIKARRAAGVHNQSAILTQQETGAGYILETQGTRGNLYLQLGYATGNGCPYGYELVQAGDGYALYITYGVDWRHVGKDGRILGYPVVSKAAGSYVGSVSLTVAPSTSGTQLVYTTDGSDPTTSSTLITGSTPFTFNENTTLKIGVLNGGMVENIESYIYTITDAATTGINVYVKTSMSNAYIWAWTDEANLTGGTWPGKKITSLDKVTVNDIEWYCLHVDAPQASVIFNNGQGGFENQTTTIPVTRDVFLIYPNSDLSCYNYSAADTYIDVTEKYAGAGSASYEKVYVLGNINRTGWAPNNGYEMTTTNGEKYTATIDFVDPYGGYSYFSFSTALASGGGDEYWPEIAGNRMGAISKDYPITEARLGTNLSVVAGENAFKIATGKYNLTLYLSQGILVVDKWTAPSPVTKGDVNNDGRIDVEDVTALIAYVLTGESSGISLDNAQCTSDNRIDVEDVTALINFVLTSVW